jgi:tetratricopeptide (TPR) repeat protein
MNLKEQLSIFINQPYDPVSNFNLGLCYDDIGHTASAYSYFLRTAEFSEDDNLVYESLLKCGQCLGKQGRRGLAEKGMYLHAMNLLPNRPEAYFILSQFYENKKSWQEAYNMASLGERTEDVGETYTFLNYLGKWNFIFQKAVTGWWCGYHVQSKELFNELFIKYENIMPDFYKELVNSNIAFLSGDGFPFCPYTSLVYHKLRFKFDGSNEIKQNYSQAYQDMFVLSMLSGKRNGTYVEIGSSDPFKGNNTALLETKFG